MRVERIERLAGLVGGTPLLELGYRFEGREGRIFAKVEWRNLTGSIKDRMALHILRRAAEEGRLKGCGEVVEASSGNTAISFAAMGRALGLRVRIFMPDWMSRERREILRALGAELVSVSEAEGGFLESIRRAREYAAGRRGAFEPRQFENEANVEAHEAGTGRELLRQLEAEGLEIDGFVAGVGTGGTVMGVARALRRRRPAVRIHPVEPAESPILSLGRKGGSHRIQGISDEFVPQIVDLSRLDAPIAVSDGDAIRTAQSLAAGLGLGVGISSGANVAAAVELARDLDDGAVVATVLPDSHKKYLSTDLFRDEPARPDHVASGLVWVGCRTVGGTAVSLERVR